MDMISLLMLVLLLLISIILIVLLKSNHRQKGINSQIIGDIVNARLEQTEKRLQSEFVSEIKRSTSSVQTIQKLLGDSQRHQFTDIADKINVDFTRMNQIFSEKQQQVGQSIGESLSRLETRFQSLEKISEQKLDNIRTNMSAQISAIQKENEGKLSLIQKTVDEKLQTTLDEKMTNFRQMLIEMSQHASDSQIKQIMQMATSQNQKISDMSGKIDATLNQMNARLTEKQQQVGQSVGESLSRLEIRFQSLEKANEQKLENIRLNMSHHLTMMQEENEKKLNSIQKTVDEKLESKLRQSFSQVSKQLETVHNTLGEMRSIASGVGDLKKVLSNVKTRGILGEIQLRSILEEILAPEQYVCEASTNPDSRDHVEFAIKLPGAEPGESVLLPIDSKFPGDTYEQLLAAYDDGNKEQIEVAKKNLRVRIRGCAKDIKDKYIAPPYTTRFAVLFLPFEGLYAEVVNLGLIEELQHEFNINVAGPSTMAAMLNSLQMGFRTLAIQKKSNDVWNILGAVKKEFETFHGDLEKAQKQLLSASTGLDNLIGRRTRAINRKLKNVETLDDAIDAERLLEISDEEGV